MEGTGRPEYGKVVDIVTKDSLRELVTPGILAVLAPIAVGFGLGVTALAGFLAGAIGTGTLMAVFLANSGGAWDNAKKLVEDGNHGGKGSPAHEATIIGDTVGDPFKDTAGPAINPLIKVMNLVSLLIASAVVSMSVGEDQHDALRIVIAAGRGRDHRGVGLHLQAARGRPSAATARARRRRRHRSPTRRRPSPGPADRLTPRQLDGSARHRGAGPTASDLPASVCAASACEAADFTVDAVAELLGEVPTPRCGATRPRPRLRAVRPTARRSRR